MVMANKFFRQGDLEKIIDFFGIKNQKVKVIEEMSDVAIIGYICEDANCKKFVARNGVELDLKAQGWNAF